MLSERALVPRSTYWTLLGLALVLLFCGMANMALGIANAVVCGFMGYIGYGIWGSVICIIAAFSGIIASRKRNQSAVVAHMVLVIIAALSATVQLAMGTGSGVVDHAVFKAHRNESTPYGRGGLSVLDYRRNIVYNADRRCADSGWMTGGGPIATDALLACFAAIQGIIAVLSAAFSCRASVCPEGASKMLYQEFIGDLRIITQTTTTTTTTKMNNGVLVDAGNQTGL